jgi:hypothetical protein
MKRKMPAIQSLERQYQALRASLSRTGYISQGSVLDRSTLRRPRACASTDSPSAGKTVTVALSVEQFEALRQAIENQRRLQGTIRQMEKLSRQILFQTVPDTRHRKPLHKKVLDLI